MGQTPERLKASSPSSISIRSVVGASLLAAWVVESVIWVASTAILAGEGDWLGVGTAALAVALLILLAGMEGLEVAVIARWRSLWPGAHPARLAHWLSSRQLFVALIVTSATLLARRPALLIPGTTVRITAGVLVDVFDLTWIGFTVLWFAQILPKALAATDSDRYLAHSRRVLFPLVDAVRFLGVSQPGEWTAALVDRRRPGPAPEEAALPAGSVSGGWAALVTADAAAEENQPTA
jgi:hypothetical protein